VDHCGNDSNFLLYSAIFILFTVHYYFDTWIQMLIKSWVNHYFSKYVDMFLACQKSKFEKCRGNCQNCCRQLLYVLQQFLMPLPSFDFREIRGLLITVCGTLIRSIACFALPLLQQVALVTPSPLSPPNFCFS
jgi:hypothetical protein